MKEPKKVDPKRKFRGGQFSRAMWDRWLTELNEGHPHASALRAGISEVRAKLAPWNGKLGNS
jgi:hypothetical protein